MAVKDVAAQRSSAAKSLVPVPATNLPRKGVDVGKWGADVVGVTKVIPPTSLVRANY